MFPTLTNNCFRLTINELINAHMAFFTNIFKPKIRQIIINMAKLINT